MILVTKYVHINGEYQEEYFSLRQITKRKRLMEGDTEVLSIFPGGPLEIESILYGNPALGGSTYGGRYFLTYDRETGQTLKAVDYIHKNFYPQLLTPEMTMERRIKIWSSAVENVCLWCIDPLNYCPETLQDLQKEQEIKLERSVVLRDRGKIQRDNPNLKTYHEAYLDFDPISNKVKLTNYEEVMEYEKKLWYLYKNLINENN